MKKQSLALHFYKSVSLDLREEFQSVQSHNSTEKCGEYDEGAVCADLILQSIESANSTLWT